MRADAGLLFALFALSVFTGLVYESVWSHYLKLFLGSAAFAQSFVLAAFMGGMALGAWLASRWSTRMKSLLRAYGWIEGLIGLAALAFHGVFVWLTEASLASVIPALGSPAAVEAYKYALCGLLIVPQTILLCSASTTSTSRKPGGTRWTCSRTRCCRGSSTSAPSSRRLHDR